MYYVKCNKPVTKLQQQFQRFYPEKFSQNLHTIFTKPSQKKKERKERKKRKKKKERKEKEPKRKEINKEIKKRNK